MGRTSPHFLMRSSGPDTYLYMVYSWKVFLIWSHPKKMWQITLLGWQAWILSQTSCPPSLLTNFAWAKSCNFFTMQKKFRQAFKSEMPVYKHPILELIIVKHVIEGITELIRNLLDLELFPINLVLNVINPEVKEHITSKDFNN